MFSCRKFVFGAKLFFCITIRYVSGIELHYQQRPILTQYPPGIRWRTWIFVMFFGCKSRQTQQFWDTLGTYPNKPVCFLANLPKHWRRWLHTMYSTGKSVRWECALTAKLINVYVFLRDWNSILFHRSSSSFDLWLMSEVSLLGIDLLKERRDGIQMKGLVFQFHNGLETWPLVQLQQVRTAFEMMLRELLTFVLVMRQSRRGFESRSTNLEINPKWLINFAKADRVFP